MSHTAHIRRGDLLIADPFLSDPSFSRAVVYIVEHNEEGTIGFVLNQPMGIMLKDVVETSPGPEFEIPLFTGGPVGGNTLHVVHQLGDHIAGSKYIANHIYWGGDFEQVKFLLGNKNADWRDMKFFVGYAGWAAGQLADELKNHSWIVLRGTEDFIFNDEDEDLWQAALRMKGGKYRLLAISPLRPEWN
ncbi:YqgE/AlgH family protein [bacterium]|nr:YqgE/AlgH family protein [bacterium]